MAIKLPPLPASNEALVIANGQINPVWYQWLKGLETRLREAGITTLLDDFHPATAQDGATMRWNAGAQRWEASL